MNKVLKISLRVSFAFILLLLTCVIVYAKDYKSTIAIGDNSSLRGKDRDYSYKKYRIDITPKSMMEGPRSPGQVILDTTLREPHYFLGIYISGTDLAQKQIIFNVHTGVNVKVRTEFGNQGSGTRYFYFSTLGRWGAGYGALNGDVVIANYN